MKLHVLTMLVVVLVFASACEGSASIAPEPEQANTLKVVQVSATALDASAEFWSEAPTLELPMVAALEGNPDGPNVTLQAVHDGESLTIRAEWADATESVLKNSWTWDGSEFSKSEDEDRLMFAWPIGNNAEFATQGCAAACHNMADDPGEWWMGSESADVRYDAWQWKAARTNPAGYVDDKWWSILEDAADTGSSRHGDAKESGGYANNRNDEQTGPLYMGNADPSTKFILAGEEVDIDVSALSAGDVIAGYVLSHPVGSRGDVSTIGEWQDGKWIMVLQRALDTGNDDDAVFTPGKPIPFGISVVDNGGGVDHAVAPDVITLEWE